MRELKHRELRWSLRGHGLFASSSVSDLSSYLAHRAAMKHGLRETAAHIRELKTAIRPIDGNTRGCSSLQRDILAARVLYAKLHDTRVLGEA